MKNPITRYATAAVIGVATVLGLLCIVGPFHGGKVYGMTDLPELLGSVKTLHVQSTQWLYGPDPNHPEFEKATVIPCEVWVDVPNLRTRFTSYTSWRRTADGMRGLNRIEGVHDRQCAMDIDHTKKTVRFNKVSVVQRRLAVRDQIQRYLNYIAEEELEHFVRVGQESIDGISYDIWEREDANIRDADKQRRIRCWVAPATGELGRIYIWSRTGEKPWRLGWCADVIERDIDILESVFTLEVPEGYRYENTRETAYGEGLGGGWYMMGGARVSVAINFTLDDGSVILAWHSDDLQRDRYEDQAHLFKDLTPGGELPELPMVVCGIKTVRLDSYSSPKVTYTGRHLAVTKKNRWYYEWALYVPDGPLPIFTQPPLYRMLCRFNLPHEQPPQVGNPLSENRIKPGEFDLFVREAMAELSDDGKAPEHVTYENVTRWAQEIRTSLAKW